METLIHSKVRISFTYLFAEVNYLIKISDHIKFLSISSVNVGETFITILTYNNRLGKHIATVGIVSME